MANIEEKVQSLVEKPITDLGYQIYDVQYVKEGPQYFLRIFIEKEEGEINLEDCEKVSNAINGILDEATYIKEQYFLEVSSTGIEKILRKDIHLQANLGSEVSIRLFRPIAISQGNMLEENSKKTKKNKPEKVKELIGILKSFDKENICIVTQNKEINIPRKEIVQIKTVFDWDNIEDK